MEIKVAKHAGFCFGVKKAIEIAEEVAQNNKNTYVGRGIKLRLLGSIFSYNRKKAEKTIKKLPAYVKLSMARKGAKNFKKKTW